MVKRFCLHILIMLYLGLCATQAQDSFLQEREIVLYRLERQMFMQDNRYRGTAISALRPERWQQSGTDVGLGYSNSTQERFDWQKGSGSRGGDFTAQSYLRDFFENTTVWGEAQYTTQAVTELNYNTSLDYDRVFPYFLADSVGGDQQMEIYQFGGGLARTYDRWTVGAQVDVRANHAFRRRDPRPNNTSAVFQVESSAAYRLAIPYTVALSVEGDIYKQTNTLTYMGELGRPRIVNLNGMGAYNNLLTGGSAGNNTTVYFSGHRFGGSVHLAPRELGFWLSGRLLRESGRKESALSFESINDWTDSKWDIDLGYDGAWRNLQYSVAASWNMQRREGREGLFTNQNAEARLVKISERLSYRYLTDRYTAAFTVGQRQWNVRLRGALTDRDEQYASPYRMQRVQQREIGADMQYFWIADKQLLSLQIGVTQVSNVDLDYAFRSLDAESGLGQLLYNNINFLRQEPVVMHGRVRWDMPEIKRWQPYIEADGGYASAIDRKSMALRVGFVF